MGNQFSKEKTKDLLIISGFVRKLDQTVYPDIIWCISQYYSVEDGSKMIGNKHLYINGPNILALHGDFEDNNDNLLTQYGGCVLSPVINTKFRGEWYWKFRMDGPMYDYEYDRDGYCAVQLIDAKYIHDGDDFAAKDVKPEEIPEMWKALTPARNEENIVYHEFCNYFTILIQSKTNENVMRVSGDLEYEKVEDFVYTQFAGENLRVVLKPRLVELYLVEYRKKTW